MISNIIAYKKYIALSGLSLHTFTSFIALSTIRLYGIPLGLTLTSPEKTKYRKEACSASDNKNPEKVL